MDEHAIAIAGAGNIGAFVGGWLAAAGRPVHFLGRARLVGELERSGLHLSDCDGASRHVAAGQISASVEPTLLGAARLILVTVKSGATAEMAELIARHAQPGATVVSLQNGVNNVALLRQSLPAQRVVAGMVPFNVVALGEGRFHRATGGTLVIESGQPWAGAVFVASGLPARAAEDMHAVAWGKLLVNLNNALNALSGLPLAEQLADRAWRTLLAASMSEALGVLARAGITPERATPVAPRLLPWLLRCPNWLYRRLAARQLQIDPKARSSMSDDLERDRPTEVDYLQGAVVDLARQVGMQAPVNARVLHLVHEAEQLHAGSPRLSARTVAAGTPSI